jgi:flagellar FliL protein
MSEQPTPPPAEAVPAAGAGAAAAGAAAALAAPKPKDAPIWMLALVVVLALGAGGALGALLIAPRVIKAKRAAAVAALDPKSAKDKKGKKKEHGKEGEGKPTTYKVENIVVNPADSQGQRFLMCSIALESDDSKALDQLRAHEVELRDRVATMLTSMTLDDLTAPGARDTIRVHLLRAIKPVLDPDDQDVDIRLYLPNFVIQ